MLMLDTLGALFKPTNIIELRALHRGKKQTSAGYFDSEHQEALVKEAARLNQQGAAVYINLNPLNPQLLGRYCNRVENYASATATDADVVQRRWLMLDFDPNRPKNISATDTQLQAAITQARACYSFLRAEGWPNPVTAESGNGYHLLYPLDLPNTPEVRDLVKGALAALAGQFDTPEVTLDQSVFNAGRITKLYGTVANKGDHTLLTPWRLSRLTSTPERSQVVSAKQLQALQPEQAQPPAHYLRQINSFDLNDFLSRLNIPYQQDLHQRRERYKLEHCPFNPEHGEGEAAIFRDQQGKLGFKCMHNSCADKGWQELRELVDGKTPIPTVALAEDWPLPGVIKAELYPVPEFDPEALLPEPFREWVIDEADRMPCPPGFIAAAVLVSLGSVIGARCGIKPKTNDDWLVIPNLWGGIVGQPSAKKSPAIGAALTPLNHLIARAKKQHEAEQMAFEDELLVFEARESALEQRIKQEAKKDKSNKLDKLVAEPQSHRRQAPPQPAPRRFKSNDTTIEKLGELLQDNSAGLLIMRDELVGLMTSWDREGREGDRAFYLEAWNGNASFDTDRIGRGSVNIPNLCVSVFGGTQPDKLLGYLEQAVHSKANDGMLQRFQFLVYPDPCQWEWRDRSPNRQAYNSVVRIFELLADSDPCLLGAHPAGESSKFPYLRFTPEAQAIFIDWSAELHQERLANEEQPIIAQHQAKYDKLFPAIALILQLAENAATGKTQQVTQKNALRAAAWCEYLEAHARRCYGLLIDSGLRAAQELANKIQQHKLQNQFTARDIRRKQWKSLKHKEQIQSALEWLVDEGWLREKRSGGSGPGTGRATIRYSINPRILTKDREKNND